MFYHYHVNGIQMLSVSQSAKHHTHDLKCCPSYKIDIYNQFITAQSLIFTQIHFVIETLTICKTSYPYNQSVTNHSLIFTQICFVIETLTSILCMKTFHVHGFLCYLYTLSKY